MNAITPLPGTLFALGQIVSTRGAFEACSHNRLMICLARHASGDWGTVFPEDAASNNEAVLLGSRLFSAYPIDPARPSAGHGENMLWIITEGDRSVTTFLLPKEY